MNSVLWRLNAERILFSVTREPVRHYANYDFGRARDDEAVSAIIAEDDAMEMLQNVREELPSDLVAFIGTTRWMGTEQHDGVELVIAPGDSQFDILLTARPDAANYNMMTGDIIKKLQDYDRRYGIDIFQAESDTIQFMLLTPPADMNAFGDDLYDFCPDIVDQGVGSVDELIDIIHETQHVMLWWD